MALLAPLQLVDSLLLNYNVGQALLVLFALVILGSLPLRSRKILSINLILFGVIFMATPGSLAPVEFRFFGLALLVLGPVLYMTAER